MLQTGRSSKNVTLIDEQEVSELLDARWWFEKADRLLSEIQGIDANLKADIQLELCK